MDTICKYWPWYMKIHDEKANKPLLSYVHGKAHLWQCQQKWGARAQIGSGLSTGETTELVNSYLSRFGLITRHMTEFGKFALALCCSLVPFDTEQYYMYVIAFL